MNETSLVHAFLLRFLKTELFHKTIQVLPREFWTLMEHHKECMLDNHTLISGFNYKATFRHTSLQNPNRFCFNGSLETMMLQDFHGGHAGFGGRWWNVDQPGGNRDVCCD